MPQKTLFRPSLLPRTVRACRTDLSSPDVQIRLAVVRDLPRRHDESERNERVELLIQALVDPIAEVRKVALVSLADLRAGEARDAVLRLLADPEINVRQMAVMALGEICRPGDLDVVGRIAALLRAGHPSIRYQALIAHSALAPDHSAADLARALNDEDSEIRELSLRLVDEVLLAEDRPIPPALLRSMVDHCQDPVPAVRLVAQIVGAQMGWETPREMIAEVVERKFKVREPRDEQSAVELSGILSMRQLIPALKRRAFGLFGFSFDPFRAVALGSLSRMGEQEAIAKLMRGLTSRDFTTRTLSVEALSQSGRVEALPALRKLRGNDRLVDQEVLTLALERLSKASSRPA